MLGGLEALFDELKHHIQEDNSRLEQEIEEWGEEQSCNIPQMESSTNSTSQDFSTSQEPSVASSHGVLCLSYGHAVIVKEQTVQATINITCAYGKSGVEEVWSEAFHEKYSRFYQQGMGQKSLCFKKLKTVQGFSKFLSVSFNVLVYLC